MKQLNEQKAKCDAIEKRENERRQVEEKKHTEEIQFLKRTNQQLKVRFHDYIAKNYFFDLAPIVSVLHVLIF